MAQLSMSVEKRWPIRIAWYLALVVAVGIFIASIPGYWPILTKGFLDPRFAFNPSPLVLTLNIISGLTSSGAALLCLFLAFLLFRRRPKDRMALFLSFYLLAFSVFAGPTQMLGPILPGSITRIAWLVVIPLIIYPATCFLFLLFPDGRFAPDWGRRLALASLITGPVMAIANLIWSRSYLFPLAAGVIGSLLPFIVMSGVVYAQFVRYRHIASRQQRQQIKWVAYGLGIFLLIQFFSSIQYFWSFTLPVGTPFPVWRALSFVLSSTSMVIIPLSLTIAVIRYKLYDIDVIINRTLVFGVFSLLIAGLYVLVVAISGAALLTSSNLTSLLLATVLAVLIVKPLYRTLQKGADRLIRIESDKSSVISTGDPGHQKESKKEQAEEMGENQGGVAASITSTSDGKRGLIRVAWYMAMAMALGIFIASMPGYVTLMQQGFIEPRFTVNSSMLVTALNITGGLVSISTVLLCLILATMLYRLNKNDRIGLILSFYLMVYGLVMAGPLELLGFYLPGFDVITQVAVMPLILTLSFTILAILPDGRFVPRWSKWVVLGSFVFLPLALVINPAVTRMSLSFSDPLILILTMMAFFLTIGISVSLLYGKIYSYRNVSTRQQKQQIKWVAYGFGLFFGLQILTSIPWVLSFSLPPTTPFPLWMAAASAMWFLSIAIIPISLSIAVMRYRLWDIDIIINRTIVYGGLSLLIAGLYVLMVGGLGTLFQIQGNLLIALLATGLAAVLFQPLRARLQRGVNRFVFGERDDPLAALSSLGRKLEEAVAPDEVLPTLVRTIAKTLKLPYVAISLRENGSLITVAEHGEPVLELITLPLVYQGERVGQLLIALRSPGEDFSPAEMVLLINIARQAGAAVRAVQLTADLQRSRERLVTSREEERRRLRRDLHDGLGPTLAGQTLKLDAALDLVEKDPAAARSLLLDLKGQTQDTVTRIRRLVYDLRPPALDDLGLAGALHAHIFQMEGAANGLHISFDAPDEGLPPLAAAVEVAAYRIAQEGLTNIVRHAQAKECQLRLSLIEVGTRSLHLEIIDDGIGLPRQHRPGVGMNSMRERAAELGGTCVIEPGTGGGTRVLACLPLHNLRIS